MIVFCNSINHAERFARHLKGSLAVHSNLHVDEQEERIQSLRDGRVSALVTVDKFNEGIDLPDVNVVVFLRSTESHTIFYQQLGRGLRRVVEKKKVLALDFVGNCERIRMIESLAREIEQANSELGSSGNGVGTPTVIDYGSFTFTEQARDILAILDKAEIGYTEEVLIAQLQAEAKRLGRTPTVFDMDVCSRGGKTASPSTFTKTFGSWNKALEAAGLPLNNFSYEPDILIAQLQTEAKRLGRVPYRRDFDASSKVGRTASPNAVSATFGTWNKALKAAGLTVNRVAGYDAATLIAQLKKEAKYLGRTPTQGDAKASSKAGRTADIKTFKGVFGTWNKALIAAGLGINKSQGSYDKQTLIAQLQAAKRRLKRVPELRDMDAFSKVGKTASASTFTHKFGTWNKALEAAGFTVNRAIGRDKAALVVQLQTEAKRLGRTPKAHDIVVSSAEKRTRGLSTFMNVFGSFNKALEAAGLPVNRERRA